MVQGVELEAERTPDRDDQLLTVEDLVAVDDKESACVKSFIRNQVKDSLDCVALHH